MKALRVFKFVGMGIVGIIAIGFFIHITMHLWNWLIPVLFHGPIISFWQAAGLLVLSKILFSGCGHGGGRRHHGHCGCHRHHNCSDGEQINRERWWKKFHDSKHCKCNEKETTVE